MSTGDWVSQKGLSFISIIKKPINQHLRAFAGKISLLPDASVKLFQVTRRVLFVKIESRYRKIFKALKFIQNRRQFLKK